MHYPQLSSNVIMNTKQPRLEHLKRRQEQLTAQIQKLESLEKSRERKRDTRRKILIGAYVMDKAKEGGNLSSLYQQMQAYLKRNSDRDLFHMILPLDDK